MGRYVSVTKDFTLEGWFRMPDLPASGQFYFIANGDGNYNAADSHRWFLTPCKPYLAPPPNSLTMTGLS